MVRVETWQYLDIGHGYEFMERGSLSNFTVVNSNLLGMGGVSQFGTQGAGIDVSSNAAPVIGATGTAAGNVVGAAVKAAVK